MASHAAFKAPQGAFKASHASGAFKAVQGAFKALRPHIELPRPFQGGGCLKEISRLYKELYKELSNTVTSEGPGGSAWELAAALRIFDTQTDDDRLIRMEKQ